MKFKFLNVQLATHSDNMVTSQAWCFSFRAKQALTEANEGKEEERGEGKKTGTKAENCYSLQGRRIVF
jgi:hypothetical protein